MASRALTEVSDDGVVLSRPMGIFPTVNAKAIRECTELSLTHLGIHKITNFEKFENLSVLWINNNAIASLSGLENNFRLRVLHAQHNQITSLSEELEALYNLQELNLAHNSLSHLEKCLAALKPLRYLRSLWLHHNPVAQEADYRLRTIVELPDLHVLDDRVVTSAEKTTAMAKYGKAAVEHRQKAGVTARSGAPSGDRSQTHRWLAREVASINSKGKSSAIETLKGAFECHVDPSWLNATRPVHVMELPLSALAKTVRAADVPDMPQAHVSETVMLRSQKQGFADTLSNAMKTTLLRFPVESQGTRAEVGPWDRYRIWDTFRSLCRDGSLLLDRARLVAAIDMCADVGLMPVLPIAASNAEYVDMVVDLITTPANQAVNYTDFLSAVEEGSFAKMKSAAAESSTEEPPMSGKSSRASSKPPSRPATGKTTDSEAASRSPRATAMIVKIPKLLWRPLGEKEAAIRAARHAAIAEELIGKAMRLPATDPEAKILHTNAAKAAEKVTFLQNHIAGLSGKFDPEPLGEPTLKPRTDYMRITGLSAAGYRAVEDVSAVKKALNDVSDHKLASMLRSTLTKPTWAKARTVAETRGPKAVTTTILRM